MPEYQSQLQQALSFLRSGDVKEAIKHFRPVLSYPGVLEQPAEFAEALGVLAEISTQLADVKFAGLLRRAAEHPTDVTQLHHVGYEMIEHGLSDMAATLLAYAYRLAPGNTSILHELSSALEREMRYLDAQRFLQQDPQLVQSDFLTCYLLAFNSVMCGDLETPRRLLPDLRRLQPHEEAFAQMTERIAEWLTRADALKGHTPLDFHDLRGWHLVLTGSLLLHLAPHGFDEPMHGRYAWMQDSYALCLLGILRVKAVLDALQLRVPRIWLLPERNSQILAHAAASIFEAPLKPWPVDGSQASGLIVAYDLSQLEGKTLASILYHRPGQILWSHATCWTESQPLSADLTTFLYQSRNEPWGERLTVDPETHKVISNPADQRDTASIAADIVAATPEEGLPEDESGLLALIRSAALAGEKVLALLHEEGPRQNQWSGSPVQSNRFL